MNFNVLSLPGLKKFQEVQDLQLDLLEKRIAEQIPDTVILCEHFPTITRGRGLQSHDRPKPIGIMPEGTDYFEIQRGGDLTWHGPGQLVVYPIFKLKDRNVEAWIRLLENQWVRVFEKLKIQAFSVPGGSGVWLKDAQGLERKIGSVGIALKRWVSFHGFAINIQNDLSAFQGFDPCGYAPSVMTNVKSLGTVSSALLSSDWREHWEKLILAEMRADFP